jgi:PAS domain S-box-containing protein
VNPAFEGITGYSRTDVMGKDPSVLSSGSHDPEFYKELWRTLGQGHTWKGRFINRRKDGTLYHEEAVISPVRDNDNKVSHYVAVKRDVTKENALADQLRQSQKMEALGRLAGQVAHDFTNTLVVMMNSAHIIKTCLSPDSEAHEFVDKIVEHGNMISSLTCQLLAFSHRQPVKMKPVNLEKVVLGVSETLERMVGTDVNVVMAGSEGRKMIDADPSQVEQVLFHLVVNARDAMKSGGDLHIQTGRTHVTEAMQLKLVAGARLIPGDYATFAVIDSGVGMDEDTQNQIFEPFFTTKGKDGSGLGLSTAYGIVKQHKGYIGVQSEQGKGTTFTVYLPLLSDETND